MLTAANRMLEMIGPQDDGFPASQSSWPSWPCPGCEDEMRAPELPELNAFTSFQGYTRAKACSNCVPALLSKHMPRGEILQLAGVPEWERSQKWDVRLAQVDGSLPADANKPSWRLESWPFDFSQIKSVVLIGRNGTGKTMLATQLLVQAYRAGVRSLAWMNCSELVDEAFSASKWETKVKAERAKRCGCLVLDEYGRGRHTSEFAYGLVGSILDARKHQLTVITSNLAFASRGDGKSFEETDSAVFDRLTEGLVVPVTGASHRGRK